MIRIFFVLIFFLSCLSGFAQADNPNYDKALAERLGGDDYGMKRFVLVILKTGSAAIQEKAVTDSLFKGHMQNINRLVETNKLIVAGPLAKNERNYRGIFILNASMDEARAILETDPAIRAKLLDVELFSWYGSAALPEYLKYHDKIEKKKM